jgi:hypothetical protein
MTRDLLDRIRRAEWKEERKAKQRDEIRVVGRPHFAASWGQITRVMGPG